MVPAGSVRLVGARVRHLLDEMRSAGREHVVAQRRRLPARRAAGASDCGRGNRGAPEAREGGCAVRSKAVRGAWRPRRAVNGRRERPRREAGERGRRMPPAACIAHRGSLTRVAGRAGLKSSNVRTLPSGCINSFEKAAWILESCAAVFCSVFSHLTLSSRIQPTRSQVRQNSGRRAVAETRYPSRYHGKRQKEPQQQSRLVRSLHRYVVRRSSTDPSTECKRRGTRAPLPRWTRFRGQGPSPGGRRERRDRARRKRRASTKRRA